MMYIIVNGVKMALLDGVLMPISDALEYLAGSNRD